MMVEGRRTQISQGRSMYSFCRDIEEASKVRMEEGRE